VIFELREGVDIALQLADRAIDVPASIWPCFSMPLISDAMEASSFGCLRVPAVVRGFCRFAKALLAAVAGRSIGSPFTVPAALRIHPEIQAGRCSIHRGTFQAAFH